MITLSLFSKIRLAMVMTTISSFPKRGNGVTMATNSSVLKGAETYFNDHSLVSSNRSLTLFKQKDGVAMTMHNLLLRGSPPSSGKGKGWS